MFVTLVHCHVKPEHADAFADACRANHEASTREPGNVRFDVLRLVEDPTRFVLYEWYVDEAAAKAHKETPHYAAWREAVADWFVEPRYGVRYEGLCPETAGLVSDRAPPSASRPSRLRAGTHPADHVRGRARSPASRRSWPATGRRVLLVTGGRSLAASGRRDALLAGLRGRGRRRGGRGGRDRRASPGRGGRARWPRTGTRRSTSCWASAAGSVLDAAKAIAGLLRTGTSVTDHLEGVGPQLPYPGPAVPLVAVPTTAGTGSEATRNAVISERGPAGYKRSFRDERLVAADAVVDPDLLAGADPVRIAANGMDARDPAARGLRLAQGGSRDRRPGPRRPRGRARRAARLARGPGRSRGARPRVRAWRTRRCCRGSASRTRAWAASTASPRRWARSCRSRTGSPAGRRWPGSRRRTWRPSRRGRRHRRRWSATRRLAGCWRGCRRRRPAAAARAALVGHAARPGRRPWRSRGCGPSGWTRPGSPRSSRTARGSSMRTNPVVLTDEELAGVLRAAL